MDDIERLPVTHGAAIVLKGQPGRLSDQLSPEPGHGVGDKADPSGNAHALWIDRVCRALRLPLWLGVLLLGLVPYPVLLIVGAKVVGLSGSLISFYIIPQLPLTVTLALVPILGTLYISRAVVKVNGYAETLLPGSPDGGGVRSPINFRSLYSVRFVTPLMVLLYLIFQAIYFEFGTTSAQIAFAYTPAILYAFFAIGATIWVFAYSMYSIWKVGHLPLAVRPFTEDRTLGLRPFGTASLKLTAVYMVVAATNLILTENLPSFVKLYLLAAFSLLGIGFFLLPLYGLHKKLVAAKEEEMDWISAEHSAVLEEMRRPGGLRDEGLATRLVTVRSVREDVERIHGWPIDTEMMARLATVVILPLVIGVGVPFLVPHL